MRDPPNRGRRTLVRGAAALAIASAVGAHGKSARAKTRDVPLNELSATLAVARMSRGEMTAEHYAQALIKAVRAGSALNAFITFEPERVLEDARTRDRELRAGMRPGPLFGLPIPVKDCVNTRDYPTTAGTPALKSFRPREDAPLVSALKAAGAIVFGKTNLHELSLGWTSNNLAFGAIHNPYDTARVPGGSSGGTAAAIAARFAPLGVAADTEGSIRVPAAFCGLVGFRPTTGRYPTQACTPISPLFDQVGPLARGVEDALLFDTTIAREPVPAAAPSLRGVRLGVVRDYWFTDLDPEVDHITELAMAKLRRAGVEIIEGRLPELSRLIDLVTDPVQYRDLRVALPEYLERYHTGVSFEELIARASADVRQMFADYVLPGGANFVTEAVYTAARDRHLPVLRKLFKDYFARERIDALVFPTVRVPAPHIGEETTIDIRGRAVPFEDAVARNIAPGSTVGLPGLVLPAGLTAAGLPVALEFDAPAGADRALLALGLSLERELGTLPGPPAA